MLAKNNNTFFDTYSLRLSHGILSLFFFFFYKEPNNKAWSTITGQVHGRIVINCTTYGVPQPTVSPKWRKNGMYLRQPCTICDIYQTSLNSLVIESLTKRDEGNYSCETLQVYENRTVNRLLNFVLKVEDGK